VGWDEEMAHRLQQGETIELETTEPDGRWPDVICPLELPLIVTNSSIGRVLAAESASLIEVPIRVFRQNEEILEPALMGYTFRYASSQITFAESEVDTSVSMDISDGSFACNRVMAVPPRIDCSGFYGPGVTTWVSADLRKRLLQAGVHAQHFSMQDDIAEIVTVSTLVRSVGGEILFAKLLSIIKHKEGAPSKRKWQELWEQETAKLRER
jgi:hypothetical protein